MSKIMRTIRRIAVDIGIISPTVADLETAAGETLRARVVGDRERAAKSRERHARILEKLSARQT